MKPFRVHPLIWLVLGAVLIFMAFIVVEGVLVALTGQPMSGERSVVVFNRLVFCEVAFVIMWTLATLGTIAYRRPR